MSDQQKHLDQSNSPAEKEAIQGAKNAAENADGNAAVAPVAPKAADEGTAQHTPGE